MSYRLLLLSRTKNNCSRRTANGENESEKENSTIRLWFFHDVKFCWINCFIFLGEAPSPVDTAIWTFNAIKDSLNDRKGKLENFHLEIWKFSLLFLHRTRTSGEMGNWSQQKFDSDWTVVQVRWMSLWEKCHGNGNTPDAQARKLNWKKASEASRWSFWKFFQVAVLEKLWYNIDCRQWVKTQIL